MQRKILHSLLFAGSCTLACAAAPATSSPPTATASKTGAPAATKPAAGASGPVHVGGSDLLQTAVGEPLTRYTKQFHLNVMVDMLGSTPAVEALKSGKIELAVVATPLGQNPAPEGFKAVPFCFTADYIVVNQANPLTAVNLRQLAGIFGDGLETIGSWSQLKLAGEWTDRPIVPYSTSTDDGVVIEMLKYLALDLKPMRANVRILDTPDDVFATIKNSPVAIGLCGYNPGPPLKVLLVSPDKSMAVAGAKPAVAPTPENIASGEYPLRLPFYLVYNPANKARVVELMRLLLSDPYAARLREAHFIPLPDTERNRVRDGLDKPD